ncbi:hypothetical protein ACFO5K_11810 [Nocardia halotolerans]|uniref:Uncharacterized protein n=1 Tax=Nocardia halotolerans TaxID=1755878 RepID=A0ABV8VIA4_9NOCA
MRRSTLILTTAGLIFGGATAIDLLEDTGVRAAPEPVAVNQVATAPTEGSWLAQVRDLLATGNAGAATEPGQ